MLSSGEEPHPLPNLLQTRVASIVAATSSVVRFTFVQHVLHRLTMESQVLSFWMLAALFFSQAARRITRSGTCLMYQLHAGNHPRYQSPPRIQLPAIVPPPIDVNWSQTIAGAWALLLPFPDRAVVCTDNKHSSPSLWLSHSFFFVASMGFGKCGEVMKWQRCFLCEEQRWARSILHAFLTL